MDKRYQVFVSSTYEDLQEERQEVMQALLELDCIPAGMELFPAANDDQWTLIKKVIDECDYYIVISAGRYGSLGKDGISYTEMEYRYALSLEKPIIAFLHRDLNSIIKGKSETEPEKLQKLNQFRELAQNKMVKHWSTPDELGAVVSRGISKLIKSNPAIGWIRSNEAPDPELAKENLRLRQQIDELERKLSSYGNRPEGIDELAQGEDLFSLNFSFKISHGQNYTSSYVLRDGKTTIEKSWNDIIKNILPRCIPEASESVLKASLETRFFKLPDEERSLVQNQGWAFNANHVNLNGNSFRAILVQLKALGLISVSTVKKSPTDKLNYWMLTPYGESMLTQLCAVRKTVPT